MRLIAAALLLIAAAVHAEPAAGWEHGCAKRLKRMQAQLRKLRLSGDVVARPGAVMHEQTIDPDLAYYRAVIGTQRAEPGSGDDAWHRLRDGTPDDPKAVPLSDVRHLGGLEAHVSVVVEGADPRQVKAYGAIARGALDDCLAAALGAERAR